MRNSALKRSGMARVNDGSHSFTCHESRLPLLPCSRTASSHFGRYSFSVPLRVEGWVGLSGWLQTEVVYPPADGYTHANTSWDRRRVTSLIEANALPLSQAARKRRIIITGSRKKKQKHWCNKLILNITLMNSKSKSKVNMDICKAHRPLVGTCFTVLWRVEGWVNLDGWYG